MEVNKGVIEKTGCLVVFGPAGVGKTESI